MGYETSSCKLGFLLSSLPEYFCSGNMGLVFGLSALVEAFWGLGEDLLKGFQPNFCRKVLTHPHQIGRGNLPKHGPLVV